MNQITIRRPDDWHVHLGQDDLLGLVLPYTQSVFSSALVMPNIRLPVEKPGQIPSPVRTASEAKWYREQIVELNRLGKYTKFTPLMTIAISDATTPEIIEEASAQNVVAGKIYPQGVTTHSEHGVSNFRTESFHSVLTSMEACGMVCCVHAELPGVFVLDREKAFIPILVDMHARHPRLKIVVEHVTTCAMVNWILGQNEYVGATITAHHLLLTLDDVIGGMISPHHFCKSVPKRVEDRDALCEQVLAGNPKFFFGSDSDPHEIHTKECASGCAGIFTAPVVVPLLTSFFEHHQKLEKLEPFVSEFGRQFYGVEIWSRNVSGEITLVREPWIVPSVIRSLESPLFGPTVVPFRAGETLAWQIKL